MTHSLLNRQLRRCGVADPTAFDPEVWPTLLERISRTYREFEEEHYLLERSLSISSEEMLQLNRSLRESEGSLLAERDKLRATFESIGDGLCVLDRDGTCLSLNAAAVRLLGWTESEAVGTRILETISDQPLLKQAMDGDVRQDDAIFRRKDASIFPVAFVLTRIVREESVRGVVLVFRDITELKDIQARLAREHDQLLAVIATAPVAMAMFDRDMRYLAHSQQWLKDFNLEARGLVGQSHYEVLPDMPMRFRENHRRGLAGEVLSNPEEQFTRADGKTMYTRWAIQPWRTQDGDIGGIIVVVARIDDLVRARQEAIETARLKAQFLANMSHEIRTPMNGVLGMSELLLDTPLSDDQRECVDTIRLSAESLLSIVNDILDFSKIEAGKLRVESTDFDVRTVTYEATRVLAGNAYRKGLEFSCAIDRDVPRRVRGDAGRLRQVLTNLVGNAVKFTATGEVGLSLRLAARSATGVRLRFEIADSGIGIESGARDRLFRAFSQGDGSSTRRHGGTGLGLAISKQLVELMHGELGVESEPGIGSTFWFEVGLEEHQGAQERVNERSRPWLGSRALVIEDHDRSRETLHALLADQGLEVQSACDGAGGLRLLQRACRAGRAFDVILVDQGLPDLDGTTVIRTIRGNPSVYGNAHLIAMIPLEGRPGIPSPDSRDGPEAVLTKPVDESHLHALLDSVLVAHLPKTEPAAPLPSRNGSSVPSLGEPSEKRRPGPSLLLAEDNPVNCKVVARMLQKLGCRFEIAVNGRQALDWMETGLFDGVLMDCQMPVMDGLEAAVRIRELEQGTGRHTPIIAITAHAMAGDRERCLASGMDDYLTKPFRFEELAAMLQKWCGLEAQARA